MQQLINIPNELRNLNRWVCWTMEDRNGKPSKVPKNAKTGGNAMANNPDTWGSFKQAVDRFKKDKLHGVGFMFNGDGIVGVDIDGCRDKETGELTPSAQDIINMMDSYTEVSASGKGIHIICKGKMPAGKKRHGSFEMYDTERYFIMTGDILESRDIIHERTEKLAIVHEKYINAQKSSQNASKNNENIHKTSNSVINLSDDDLINKAIASKNGSKFEELMNGNWTGIYSSQSEADMALCNILAFWSGKNEVAMDRIFRRSGLYREKWDERRPGGTYGSVTIQEAIDKCDKVYEPPKEKTQRKPKLVEAPIPADYDDGFEHLLNDQEKKKTKTFSQDDIGNAERLISKFGEDIRFCPSFGKWLLWLDNHWGSDERGSISEYARQTARSIIVEAYNAEEDKRDNLLKHARKSCSNLSMRAMVEQAKSMINIPVLPNELDQDAWKLNVKNGTIDLRTGKLKDHQRKDLITKMCPVEYDPNAIAPLWEKFLDRIFGSNQELITFIQKSIGYSLTGSTKEEVFFILYGKGGNGKSKFLEVISTILGGYATQAALNTFMDKQNDAVSNDIAMLKGARMVQSVETRKGQRLNESLVKQLTGGDMITARFLRQEFFQFKPEFKIFIATNHKPQVGGDDEGIWRRLRLIPFSVRIPEEERDNDLIFKLLKELPGVLNWAIEGCLSWQKNGLKPPECVRHANEIYRTESDTIGLFLEECTQKQPGSKASVSKLYELYSKWATDSGEILKKKLEFNRQLEELGYVKTAGNGNKLIWNGLKFNDGASYEPKQQTFWYDEK